MTKWFAEKNRFNVNNETPIAIRNYHTTNSNRTYYCSWCNRSLVKLQGRSGENVAYYCEACSIQSNPEEIDLKSKPSIEPQEGGEDNPLATTKFVEPTVGKKPIQLKGAFAALKARGMKIKYYKDEEGTISE
jgi:hypothetical protein